MASKDVADYLMLRRKLPDELFAMTRRLGHRMGLASWAGPGCADGKAFEELVRAFDVLDGSDAFVHPDAMAAIAASDKQAERAALDAVASVVDDAMRRHGSDEPTGLFGRIVQAWAAEPVNVRHQGIAMDMALIHIASMSNLMAALGWAIVDLLVHPGRLVLVTGGNEDLAQRCALESTRLAQRSIMARAVLQPVAFDTGDAVVDVPPGWTIATLLPLLNASAARVVTCGGRGHRPPASPPSARRSSSGNAIPRRHQLHRDPRNPARK